MAALATGGGTGDHSAISKRDFLPGEQVCKRTPHPPPAKLPPSPSLVFHSVPAVSKSRSKQGSQPTPLPNSGPVADLQLLVGSVSADLNPDAHSVEHHSLAAYNTSLCHATNGSAASMATILRSTNQQSSIKRVRFADLVRGRGSSPASIHSPPPAKSCLRYGRQDVPAVNGADHAAAAPGDSIPSTLPDQSGSRWTTVHYKRRLRPAGEALPTSNSKVLSRRPTTSASLKIPRATSGLLASMQDKCFRCLARGHRAAECRDPVKCFKCGRSGHKSWHCPQNSKASKTTTPQPPSVQPQAPPPLDHSNFPPLGNWTMAFRSSTAIRPEESFAVAHSCGDMDIELDHLASHAVWAWLGRDRPAIGIDVIKKAFCSRFAVLPVDITVARHYPEDFFITFVHRHHRDAAVACRDFQHGNLDIRVRQWQLPIHGDHDDLKYHVRLCLEGIPLQAWNESIAKRVVASSCDLHYIDADSLQRRDARTLNMWAWTTDPQRIPKVTWLTLTCRSASSRDGMAPAPRRGLTFRVLVHLDLVEEQPSCDGRMRAPRRFEWKYGIVDGESSPRDRNDPPPSSRLDNHRRDDEDGDDYDSERRGRRSRKEDTWSARFFRSLSRAPSERCRSSSRHGRRRDVEHPGRRRAREGRCDAATSTLAASTSRVRGRSRVRRLWRRVERRSKSPTRVSRLTRTAPGSSEGTGDSHHPSPQPPRMRADPKLCTEMVSTTQLQEASAQHVDNNLGMHLPANDLSDVRPDPSRKENCYNDSAGRCLIPIQDVLKGKCAFGPFLNILVIECQHKCLNVNLCPRMDKVQITSKGMFLSLSTLVLSTNIFV
jgi:hypothetical protein